MAKKQTRTSLEGINDSLEGIEQRIEQNKKYIYWVFAGILAIVAAVLVYIYLIREPGIQEAERQVGQADMVMLMHNNPDSALTLYKRAADASSYKPAKRAAQMAGVLLAQKGKYAEAIKYLEQGGAEGKIVGPAVKSCLADCYVNQKKYSEAISLLDDAIKMAGDNEQYAPLFMMKKATVLHATKKYADELATYEAIKAQFPSYGMSAVNIDKYIERAKALAGK